MPTSQPRTTAFRREAGQPDPVLVDGTCSTPESLSGQTASSTRSSRMFLRLCRRRQTDRMVGGHLAASGTAAWVAIASTGPYALGWYLLDPRGEPDWGHADGGHRAGVRLGPPPHSTIAYSLPPVSKAIAVGIENVHFHPGRVVLRSARCVRCVLVECGAFRSRSPHEAQPGYTAIQSTVRCWWRRPYPETATDPGLSALGSASQSNPERDRPVYLIRETAEGQL
jgi:hypothetical protein